MRIVGLGPILCGALLGVTAASAAPGDFDRGFGVYKSVGAGASRVARMRGVGQ
jgi:hypothetical protein